MSQVNPGLFNTMNLKTELEPGQGGNTAEAAQYLNRVLKRPVPEKPSEIWRTYLRRYKNMQEMQRVVRLDSFVLMVRKQSECFNVLYTDEAFPVNTAPHVQ